MGTAHLVVFYRLIVFSGSFMWLEREWVEWQWHREVGIDVKLAEHGHPRIALLDFKPRMSSMVVHQVSVLGGNVAHPLGGRQWRWSRNWWRWGHFLFISRIRWKVGLFIGANERHINCGFRSNLTLGRIR